LAFPPTTEANEPNAGNFFPGGSLPKPFKGLHSETFLHYPATHPSFFEILPDSYFLH
jgi:hypothetical protein